MENRPPIDRLARRWAATDRHEAIRSALAISAIFVVFGILTWASFDPNMHWILDWFRG